MHHSLRHSLRPLALTHIPLCRPPRLTTLNDILLSSEAVETASAWLSTLSFGGTFARFASVSRLTCVADDCTIVPMLDHS